ncbi:MAG: TFIIB-type zinc ribbon-containing protein [Haloarculaceae archaeon]
MKVRGERECKECGTRWSYYETGSVECPSCGSLLSVGTDEERKLHTASTAELDLSDARLRLDGPRGVEASAEAAAEACRAWIRRQGFLGGGELLPLSDRHLAVAELANVAGELARRMTVDDDEEYHYLTLLRGAEEGERPEPEAVPDSLREARGLAVGQAVSEYVSEVRTYLDEHPDSEGRRLVERIGDHAKRVRAVDGAVPPEDAERLVAATRALQRYLAGEESALLDAESRLDALEAGP